MDGTLREYGVGRKKVYEGAEPKQCQSYSNMTSCESRSRPGKDDPTASLPGRNPVNLWEPA